MRNDALVISLILFIVVGASIAPITASSPNRFSPTST